jgi:predicted dehydrogenase
MTTPKNPNKQSLRSKSRRRFLRQAGAGAVGMTILPRYVLGGQGVTPPSRKLNVAVVGAGGQGMVDLRNLLQESDVQIIAIADVAEVEDYSATYFRVPGGRGPGLKRIREVYSNNPATKDYPEARVYVDFRKMLDAEKEIDAVLVATPDHTHAVAAMAVIQRKKHLYIEKPMARTIWEVRKLTEAAREAGVVTQMGQQGHAGEGIRLTYEWIRDGAIGPVREVHAWTAGANISSCDKKDLQTAYPVPEGLDWDLWLGPVKHRPYHPSYAPYGWRQYWDFGTGRIADMGCHHIDPAFFALDLGYPEWVQARSAWANPAERPLAGIVQYQFPARGDMPPVKLTWWDGLIPPRPDDLEPGRDLTGGGNGTLFVGDKGKIMCPGWAGTPRLIPETKMREYQRPAKTLPRVGGIYRDWINACKEGKKASSDFSYSGPFTEVILLGVVAMRTEQKLYWDGPDMKATNYANAEQYVIPKYENGWTL